jgi:hypothetical protein
MLASTLNRSEKGSEISELFFKAAEKLLKTISIRSAR